MRVSFGYTSRVKIPLKPVDVHPNPVLTNNRKTLSALKKFGPVICSGGSHVFPSEYQRCDFVKEHSACYLYLSPFMLLIYAFSGV